MSRCILTEYIASVRMVVYYPIVMEFSLVFNWLSYSLYGFGFDHKIHCLICRRRYMEIHNKVCLISAALFLDQSISNWQINCSNCSTCLQNIYLLVMCISNHGYPITLSLINCLCLRCWLREN